MNQNVTAIAIVILSLIVMVIGLAWFMGPDNSEQETSSTRESIDSGQEEISGNEVTGDEVTITEKIITDEIIDENIIDKETKNQNVIFKTNKGDIEIELFLEKSPITAGNFLKLAEEGFYNETKFHRVISNFMIQGGDPTSIGDDTSLYGKGGPGYTIEDEFMEGFSNVRGTISMANTGQANSGGSQFFINLADNSNLDFNKEPLSSKHPVFGRVVSGMEVVDLIAGVQTGANDIPIDPVIINEILINK